MSDDLEAGLQELVSKKVVSKKNSGGINSTQTWNDTGVTTKIPVPTPDLATALTNAVIGAAEKCAKQLEQDADELLELAKIRRDENYKAAASIRDCAKMRAQANSEFVEALKESKPLTDQIMQRFIPQESSWKVDAVSKTA